MQAPSHKERCAQQKSPDSGGGSSALSSSEKSNPGPSAQLTVHLPSWGVPMQPDLGLLTLDHQVADYMIILVGAD